MIKNNYIFAGLVLLMFLACEKTNIDPELVINVDDEFKVDLWENIEGGSPTFSFLIQTYKEYTCADNTIKYSVNTGGNTFVIRLDQIDQKSDCVPGLAPATAIIPLEQLEKGNYNISIKLKETIKNTGGILQVTDEKYVFTLEGAVGIDLVRNELFRVPRGTIWGFVAYQNDSDKPYAEDFIREVENLETVNHTSFSPGYYGYFSVSDQQDYEIYDEQRPANRAVQFVYKYSGNIKDLKEKAESLSQDSEGKAVVKLFWFL